METNSFRDPSKIMKALVAASAELIHARDPELGAALDVPPPSVNPTESPTHFVIAGDGRGLAYRAARKFYRKLKHMQSLQPILEKVRDEVRRRS
jgi:hypothetical protein